MVHPVDLPEISSHVASYLSNKSLLHCILVNRAWHYAFLPTLWSDVHFDAMNQQAVDSLARHSHFVKSLSWKSYGSQPDVQILSIDFPRLLSLHANIDKSWDDDMIDAAERLFRRHGHALQTISIFSDESGPNWMISSRSLWDIAATGCKGYSQLRSLSLDRVCFFVQDLDNESKELLKQLDSFSLNHTVLYRANSSDPVLPQWGLQGSKIRQLALTNCEHSHPSDHLQTEYQLLADCQEIQSLKWERYLRHSRVSMATDLQRGFWPFLEKLDFQGLEIGDEALAEILWTLPRPLRDLNANHTGFGPLSYRALLNLFESGEGTSIARGQNHASTLERLVLQACRGVSGPQIQSFLCSMPKLKAFSAVLLIEADVLADPRPWVCKQIRNLELNFALLALDAEIGEGYPLESVSRDIISRQKSTCFWKRLKDLSSLEEFSSGNSQNIALDMNDLIVHDNGLRYPFLLFQQGEDHVTSDRNCEWGLGTLKTWRKMRRLLLWDSAQVIRLSDAQWMVQNWPHLEEVVAYKWRGTQDGVKELFEAHGVRF
ncbi:hypothetical protein EMPS_03768 [Entomortierella parvispora]|uniref:F-box domain-containing protein n=1 Tax=Entomortierella parvispora TaxID=205924 RepID=A0A9P3H7E7_9FUNG|nr:hypothetical protein EMPS_03768 [Entomortierella parvispora]